MVLPFFAPACFLVSVTVGVKEAKEPAGKSLRPLHNLRLIEFGKNPACLSSQFVARANHRFEFHKPAEFFVRVHNEPVSVAAMRVRNPDRAEILRRQENFACVRIFYCGCRRKTGDVDVTAIWRERTRN